MLPGSPVLGRLCPGHHVHEAAAGRGPGGGCLELQFALHMRKAEEEEVGPTSGDSH